MIGIGDYDSKSRNTRKVKTKLDGQVLFNGNKYVWDGHYFILSGGGKNKKRLHVAVWEYYNKREVPEGCVIHHIDRNKKNNKIENLAMVTRHEHNLIHNPPSDLDNLDLIGDNDKEIILSLKERGLM